VIDFLCLLNWPASRTPPKPQFVDFSAPKGQGTENKHIFKKNIFLKWFAPEDCHFIVLTGLSFRLGICSDLYAEISNKYMWDVFKCIKSSPEVPHAIILVCVKIDAPTVFEMTMKFKTHL
jgi:hypothetical protein